MNKDQIDFLDVAESILERSMDNYDQNPSAAFRAAMYILTNKGHSRGWGNTNKDEGLTPDMWLQLGRTQEDKVK